MPNAPTISEALTSAPPKFKHVELSELRRFVEDDAWVMQQKLDGTRAQLRVSRTAVQWVSGGGGPLKHAAAAQWFSKFEPVIEAIQASLQGPLILDGEMLHDRGEFWVFDCPAALWLHGLASAPLEPYERRYNVARMIVESLDDPRLQLVPTAQTRAEKLDLGERLTAAAAEGFMVKRRSAPYELGRVGTTLKVKFVKTADVVVLKANSGGKRNMVVGAYRPDGSMKEVANVTMIGKPDVVPGEVVEVKYLYMGDGGRLVQPRYKRHRSLEEKRPEDCMTDQFTPTSRDVLDVVH